MTANVQTQPSAAANSQEDGWNLVANNRFYVEMGAAKAAFSECSGLRVEIEHSGIYMEGGVNNQQRVLLGHARFSNVTLKRGVTNDLSFWEWLNQLLSGKKNTRRNVNILTFNQAGQLMQSWTLIGAIPVVWQAPPLQASGNAIAIEELTLAYEGLRVVTQGQDNSDPATPGSKQSEAAGRSKHSSSFGSY